MQEASKFKQVGELIKQQVHVIDALEENPKVDFIKQYGVQVQMPANYIYHSAFYKPDPKYIISTNYFVFPKDITYLDFDRIGSEQPPEDNTFAKDHQAIADCISFQAYQLVDQKYVTENRRTCDSSYQSTLCFSEDCKRLAIVRKVMIESKVVGFFKKEKFCVDIFDTSSIDFFLSQDKLTPSDPRLLMTIAESNLPKANDLESTEMSLSKEAIYLTLIIDSTKILIYDLTKPDDKKEITTAVVVEKLYKNYEKIVGFKISDGKKALKIESLIAAKRNESNTIEIFPLEFLIEANSMGQSFTNKQSLANSSSQEFLRHNNKESSQMSMKFQSAVNERQVKYMFSYIKDDDLDIEKCCLTFSEDFSHVFCHDDSRAILVRLTTVEDKQVSKNVLHMQNKVIREVACYGPKEFLIVAANNQDKEIEILHSSDHQKKIKLPFRYNRTAVEFRSITCSPGGSIELIITRDDEEFIVQKFESLDSGKNTFWGIILETSNYIFEWPYICYLRGQTVFIQNTFSPEKAVFVEIKNQASNTNVSHISVTESYMLYIVLDNQSAYEIYEYDMQAAFSQFVRQSEMNSNQERLAQKATLKATLTSKIRNLKPVIKIDKSEPLFAGRPIFKFYIRGESKEYEHDADRMIFFCCNYILFAVEKTDSGEHKVVKIDYTFKLKLVNTNQYLFQVMNQKLQSKNEIHMLSLYISQYQTTKIYEEIDGQIVDFLALEQQLMVLTKPNNEEQMVLKVFDYNGDRSVKPKFVIPISDQNFIGYFQTIEIVRNNMLPAGNDLYQLIQKGEPKLLYYSDVIPLNESIGEKVLFQSPVFNSNYRKMLYFISNKNFKKTKIAIVLPYLNDNNIIFNKRESIRQFCQFYEYFDFSSSNKTEILNVIPSLQNAYHYKINGQLLEVVKMSTFHQKNGDQIHAVSPNGKVFLLGFEEDFDMSLLSVTQVTIETPNIYSRTKTRDISSSPNAKMISNMITKAKNSSEHSEIDIQAFEQIETSKILVEDEYYQSLKKKTLLDVIMFYKSIECDVVLRINNNLDIVIGLVHNNKTKLRTIRPKYLKDLFLLKKEGDFRKLLLVRYLSPEQIILDQQSVEREAQTKQQLLDTEERNAIQLTQKLLGVKEENEEVEDLKANNLQKCTQFLVMNELLLVYSPTEIYFGELGGGSVIKLQKSAFRIKQGEEAEIERIFSGGQSEQEKIDNDYFIYIKIIVEKSYSFMVKYSITIDREYQSIECDKDAQIFFDKNGKGYILDRASIIDIDQGIPLYFYKTGMQDVNPDTLVTGFIDRGHRFCSRRSHFMVKNKVYLPFSYLILVMQQNGQKNQITLNKETYDPDAFYCIKGDTILHQNANNFKTLEFLLTQYELTSPYLLNILLLKNNREENTLQIALKSKNSRCVNLILDKISSISLNNIHALKNNFKELLDYQGFQKYLNLCLSQSKQMEVKTVLARKEDSSGTDFMIGSHPTRFLDEQFYAKFEEKTEANLGQPVEIKAIDASWILKSSEGVVFQLGLCETDNLKYFGIETIKLLIRYQWKLVKPLIIKWLFIPFIVNFLLFNVYCLYLFDSESPSEGDSLKLTPVNLTIQIILLLFTVQIVYVETKQIYFHKAQYFKTFWNIMDMSLLILQPTIMIMDIFDVNGELDHLIRPSCRQHWQIFT